MCSKMRRTIVPTALNSLVKTCGLSLVSHTRELKDDDFKARRRRCFDCAWAKRHRIFRDAADDVNKRRQKRATGIK